MTEEEDRELEQVRGALVRLLDASRQLDEQWKLYSLYASPAFLPSAEAVADDEPSSRPAKRPRDDSATPTDTSASPSPCWSPTLYVSPSLSSSSSSASSVPATDEHAPLDDSDVGQLRGLVQQLGCDATSSQYSLSQVDVSAVLEQIFSLLQRRDNNDNDDWVDGVFEQLLRVADWSDGVVASAVRALLQLSCTTTSQHTARCLAALLRRRVLQLERPVSRDVFAALGDLSRHDPAMLVDVVFVNLLRSGGPLTPYQTELSNRLVKECLPVAVVPLLLDRLLGLLHRRLARLSEDLLGLFKSLLDMKDLELSPPLAELLVRVLEMHADDYRAHSKFSALIFTIVTRHAEHAVRLHDQLHDVLASCTSFMAKPALKKLQDLVKARNTSR